MPTLLGDGRSQHVAPGAWHTREIGADIGEGGHGI
jgi:hypothetical protein